MIGDGGLGCRHPHQVLIACLCVMSGAPILFTGPRHGDLAAVLPVWLVYVWGGVLTLGGAVLIAAAAVKSPTTALFLERTADLPLAIMTAVYGIAAVVVGSRPPSIVALFVACAAFAVRYWQVTRTVRTLRAALRRQAET